MGVEPQLRADTFWKESVIQGLCNYFLVELSGLKKIGYIYLYLKTNKMYRLIYLPFLIPLYKSAMILDGQSKRRFKRKGFIV